MPPKTMYEAYDDEFSWSQFRAWAEATYGNNYDAEYTLFDLVDHNFKTNPIMTEANMIFMQVIGAPHLEWDSMQYLSCELPLELRLHLRQLVRVRIARFQLAARGQQRQAVPPLDNILRQTG